VGGYLENDHTKSDRAQFDDISDYAGYDQTGIKAIDGSPVIGLENYKVAIIIDTSSSDNSFSLNLPAGDIKKVTVAVTRGVNTITLTGYRTNYE
jgi:hypothetical protein